MAQMTRPISCAKPTDKVCPFCGFKLTQTFGDFTCPNNECMVSERLRGSEEMWAVLSALHENYHKAKAMIRASRDTFRENNLTHIAETFEIYLAELEKKSND